MLIGDGALARSRVRVAGWQAIVEGALDVEDELIIENIADTTPGHQGPPPAASEKSRSRNLFSGPPIAQAAFPRPANLIRKLGRCLGLIIDILIWMVFEIILLPAFSYF